MQQFWLINLFFITLMLSALAYFAAGWLYLDAHKAKPDRTTLLRAAGFFVLTAASLLGIFSTQHIVFKLALIFGYLIGSILITIGIRTEKINPIPKFDKPTTLKSVFPFVYFPAVTVISLFVGTYLLWRRYSKGLEREYRLWVWSWLLLSISQLFSLAEIFRDSTNVSLNEIGKLYGWPWIISITLQLVSSIILILWVWNFLRFQIKPQLFLSFLTVGVIMSATGAAAFSTLLFTAAEDDFNQQLRTNAQTAIFSVNQLKASALTSANFLAKSESIRNLLAENNLNSLLSVVTDYATTASDIDYIAVTDNAGSILIKTNEFSAVGTKSLGSDPLVVFAVTNKESRVTLMQQPDVLAPRMEIIATAPVLAKEGTVVGTIRVGFVLDNAFADNLRKQTNLEATVFTDATRSASTLTDIDEKFRAENTNVTNESIKKTVLESRSIYSGTDTILNVPFYSAYAPLVDVNNNVVGMISVGRPQALLLQAIQTALFNTFLIAIVLAALLLVPAYRLAVYVYRNYRV